MVKYQENLLAKNLIIARREEVKKEKFQKKLEKEAKAKARAATIAAENLRLAPLLTAMREANFLPDHDLFP
jgi:hypothetical protein